MSLKLMPLLALMALVSVFAISCSKDHEAKPELAAKRFNSTGVIKAIDIAGAKVTIDHQDIPGFMSAMEMSFSAANADVLSGFTAGDNVAFTLEKTGSKVALVNMAKDARPAAALSGADLFALNCAECHGQKGEGAEKGIPLNSGHALAHSEAEYVKQVVNGKGDKMPAFREKLSDEQIDAVVKYVRNVIQADIKPEQREPHH